jgi:hypothetical protein
MKKMLADQQQINNAVKYIMEYFGGEVPYSVHIVQMLDAQTQIIGLMELAKHQMLVKPDTELEYETDQIAMFLRDVRQYLKMLEPFANLLGQTGLGNQN